LAVGSKAVRFCGWMLWTVRRILFSRIIERQALILLPSTYQNLIISVLFDKEVKFCV
jgi:hypothetical protein